MRVLFFSLVRSLTGEKETLVTGVHTVQELLAHLSERYGPTFGDEVFPDGTLSAEHIIMVNGRHIAHSGGEETPLTEEDTVTIFPMIAGG